MADAQDVAASLEAAAKVIKAFTLQGMSVTFAPAGPATGQASSNIASLHNSAVNASSGPLNASTAATRATTANAAVEPNPNAQVATELTSPHAGDEALGAATPLRSTRQGTTAQARPTSSSRIGAIASSSSRGTSSQVRNTMAAQGQRHAGSSAADNFGSSSSSSLMATRKRSRPVDDGEVNVGRPRPRPRPRVLLSSDSDSIARRLSLRSPSGDDSDPELPRLHHE